MEAALETGAMLTGRGALAGTGVRGLVVRGVLSIEMLAEGIAGPETSAAFCTRAPLSALRGCGSGWGGLLAAAPGPNLTITEFCEVEM